MNKPYHIIVWDTLNEVFGTDWKILYDYDTECCYESISIHLITYNGDDLIELWISIYWKSGNIEFIYGDSNIKDTKGNDIEWDLYIWDNKFKTVNPEYGYDDNPTFDNLETFKQFLEHNKRRFYEEI